MPSTRSSRKRQVRLTFTPLPSSSPAAHDYNKQIQDRAAAVGYEGSSPRSNKKRKIDGNSIPTPNPTAEKNAVQGSEGSDSEPVYTAQTRSAIKRSERQGKLEFTNHSGTSLHPNSSLVISSSPTASASSRGMFRRPKQRCSIAGDDSDEGDENEDELASPAEVAKARKRSRQDKGGKEEKNARVTRSGQKQTTVAGDFDGDNITVAAQPAGRILSDLNVQADGQTSSDDEMPTTQGKLQRRGRKAVPAKDEFIDDDSFPELDNDDGEDDSDDVQIVEAPNRRHRRKSQSSEEDDMPLTSHKRKLQRPRKFNHQEQADLDADLDFLGPSSDVDELRRPRNTQSEAKTAKQLALERLKQKRSGHTQITPATVEDKEEKSEDEGGITGDDESDFGVEDDIRHAPTSTQAMFEANAEDEDFVESEPENNALGVPDGIPLEFTRYGSMKPKELFKYAVEWMVHKKLNPAFANDDDIYRLTFRKIDDEVRGLAGSKFTSSAWTPEFTKALKARPEINFERIDRSMGSEHFLRDKCDACNRTSHPATFEIRFTGIPYFPDSLAEVDGEHDDDSSSSSSQSSQEDADEAQKKEDHDHLGNILPPASKIFYVGKFCMANAETAHALQHWKFHLNEFVATWLIRNGFDAQQAIVKRDKMSGRKRRRHAEKVADRMEKEGVVRELWKVFRDRVNSARNSKQGRFEV